MRKRRLLEVCLNRFCFLGEKKRAAGADFRLFGDFILVFQIELKRGLHVFCPLLQRPLDLRPVLFVLDPEDSDFAGFHIHHGAQHFKFFHLVEVCAVEDVRIVYRALQPLGRRQLRQFFRNLTGAQLFFGPLLFAAARQRPNQQSGQHCQRNNAQKIPVFHSFPPYRLNHGVSFACLDGLAAQKFPRKPEDFAGERHFQKQLGEFTPALALPPSAPAAKRR